LYVFPISMLAVCPAQLRFCSSSVRPRRPLFSADHPSPWQSALTMALLSKKGWM
jgi:hypothetical protein